MEPQHIAFLELFNGQVQYVVPRWQRRYCWGQSDIERLVDDLVTVARAPAGSIAAHYGGTLLTFPGSRTSGVVTVHRVVDGQQRLTTVSILLACIADALGANGQCGEWTAEIIKNDRLTNPGKSADRLRKLRLQDGDEEEYWSGLEGNLQGAGAITQAWRIVRRLVRQNDVAQLLEGLQRFRVVSIGLGEHDDPQQIFESLNATGRPLTESEKLKNWLLMGLPDAEQQELHDRHWKRIEASLNAEYSTDRIDTFLRDFLRWKTGELRGIRHVYEDLRRWAVRNGKAEDRRSLCSELADIAERYGILTGTGGSHGDKHIERELSHLRALGFDTHRPLTLRLLCEAAAAGDTGWTNVTLAKVFAGIGTWVTRFWLSGRPMAGMNKAFAELAHGPGPADDEDPAEFWLGRIRKFRNSRVEVPDDEVVRDGIGERKAYGGSATGATKAVLCAMMEEEQRGDSPARVALTVEHVMPQKLTDEWRLALGDDAERIHGWYRDRLANLTLSGVNAELGAKSFEEKREIMKRSGVQLTRCIADEDAWDEAALERRAEYLADRALTLWPWSDPDAQTRSTQDGTWQMKWRIEGGDWHQESAAAQVVLNVAGALLSRDPKNADRLRGDAVSSNLQLASQYPSGTKAGTLTMRAVPGHDSYVLYPYGRDLKASAARCRKMGEQCGLMVEIEFPDTLHITKAFWAFLKEETGGLPGQSDGWRSWNCWTTWLNDARDVIGVSLTDEWMGVYLRASEHQNTPNRVERMLQYSREIRKTMSDQEFDGNEVSLSKKGRSISVRRTWDRDDKDGWPEAARWIKDQADRLQDVAETFVSIPGQVTD
ncbi:MAG: DUF262 domain-containing protein [Bacteroidetes bacterium SB0662_bin_6]|nr:DUF262 domain-containing protein [Bacteroidetes bacterium SB0668_bin_1]MYE04261.1 DUF262 domain-containing protein [Bacteroidetes bacterium SB0662_bin_6]